MFAFSTLLWPMTPDIFLAKWWWTIILARKTAVSRAPTPATVMAALIPPENTVAVQTPLAATAARRRAKAV